jgi:pimeloyl-ACP methyl ester carboxylesterase
MPNEFSPFSSHESRGRFLAHLTSVEDSWPIQHASTTVKTRYGDTFVRTGGSEGAPPLVLLPGGQSTSLIWRRLIKPLSSHFHTYALDAIYDEGRSVPTRPLPTIDDLRLWLDDVLDGLGLNDGITMAGMSYGCYAAAEYALHSPLRISKLVWIAPVMIGAPLGKEFIERLTPLADGKRTSLETFCRWVMPSIAANCPEEFNQRIDEILLVRDCYGQMFPPVRAAMMSDEDLKSIIAPTLYILGEQDGATSDASQAIARVQALIPHVETMLVPGAGHDVVAAEQAALTERILKFLLEYARGA